MKRSHLYCNDLVKIELEYFLCPLHLTWIFVNKLFAQIVGWDSILAKRMETKWEALQARRDQNWELRELDKDNSTS